MQRVEREIEWALVSDSQRFYQMFKFYASTPARLALLRLFDEDILPRSVARVWKDELQFEDPKFTVTVKHWVPYLIAFLLFVLVMSYTAIFAVPFFSPQSKQLHAFIMGLHLALWVPLVWAFWQLLLPYNACVQLVKFLDEVNADLPGLFDQWRASRWYRQGPRTSGEPSQAVERDETAL
ncbi:hypothetical protein YWS52_02440 [Chitiniphilus shinanonensis]